MAASNLLKFTEGLRQSKIFYTQVRNHIRVQTRNPREPFFERKRMIEVCAPVYPVDKRPNWQKCQKNLIQENNQINTVHPYHKLLANQMQEEWSKARMICFYHVNPVGEEEKKAFRNLLFKQGMLLKFYANEVVNLVLRGTKYESILHLFPLPGAILFCKESSQILKLLNLNKKGHKFIMLAGLVEDRLLSHNDLVQLSMIPDIDYARGQMVSILSQAAGSRTSTLLGHQQKMLSTNLDQRQKQINQES